MSNFEIVTGEVIESGGKATVETSSQRVDVRRTTSVWLKTSENREERFDIGADLPVREGHEITLVISRHKTGLPHVWFAANKNTRQEYLKEGRILWSSFTGAFILGVPISIVLFNTYDQLTPAGVVGVFISILFMEIKLRRKLIRATEEAKVLSGYDLQEA